MNIDEIKISFLGGTDIKDAAYEAYHLLCAKNCYKVSFNFNGVNVSIERPLQTKKIIERS